MTPSLEGWCSIQLSYRTVTAGVILLNKKRANVEKILLSEDGKIKSIKFNYYVSFMQGAKSANNELFKDFCNEAEMEQNC